MSTYQNEVIPVVIPNKNNNSKNRGTDSSTSVISLKQKGTLVRIFFVLFTIVVTLMLSMGGRGGKHALLSDAVDVTDIFDNVGCVGNEHVCRGFGKGNCCDGYTCCSMTNHNQGCGRWFPIPGCGFCTKYGNCSF